MDDADIAKIILINDNIIIKAYPVVQAGGFTQSGTEKVVSFSSFEPVEYLKFNLSILIKEFFPNIKQGNCFIFTNWHLENQDIKRSIKDFYIWGNNKIYKNELIKGFISDYKYQEDETNPFEKKIYAEANLLFRILEPAAKTILPQLKSIYITYDNVY